MSRILTIWNILILTAVGAIAYYFYSNHQTLMGENEKLTAELVELESQWTQLRHEEGELAFARQELAQVTKRTNSLRPEILDLGQAITEKQADIEFLEEKISSRFFEYRKQLRKEAKGMSFDEIKTPQGKMYYDVRIIEIRPDGISIGHGAEGTLGLAGLGLHEIPEEWIERFMYTEEDLEWARGWTSSDGTETVHGKFKSYDEETGVVIILVGDRKRSLNIDNLSTANRDWLENKVKGGDAKGAANFALLDKQVIGSKIKKGVLSKLDGNYFYDFTLRNVPNYYVVYYSASW